MGPYEIQEKLSDKARCRAVCRDGERIWEKNCVESKSSCLPHEAERRTRVLRIRASGGKAGPDAGAPSVLAQRRPVSTFLGP